MLPLIESACLAGTALQVWQSNGEMVVKSERRERHCPQRAHQVITAQTPTSVVTFSLILCHKMASFFNFIIFFIKAHLQWLYNVTVKRPHSK